MFATKISEPIFNSFQNKKLLCDMRQTECSFLELFKTYWTKQWTNVIKNIIKIKSEKHYSQKKMLFWL